jgi:hypothetical protein
LQYVILKDKGNLDSRIKNKRDGRIISQNIVKYIISYTSGEIYIEKIACSISTIKYPARLEIDSWADGADFLSVVYLLCKKN